MHAAVRRWIRWAVVAGTIVATTLLATGALVVFSH